MKDQSSKLKKTEKGSTLPEAARKSFRVPVEDGREAMVIIDTEQYPVLDICIDGVGITIGGSSVFTIGQTIENCGLDVLDVSIKGLTGQVIHISLNLGRDWRCGIHWVNINEGTADQMSTVFSKMKEKLLKDDGISPDQE